MLTYFWNSLQYLLANPIYHRKEHYNTSEDDWAHQANDVSTILGDHFG